MLRKILFTIVASLCIYNFFGSVDVKAQSWYSYGGDAGGTRYMPFDSINKQNVDSLKIAWTFRSGELGQNARHGEKLTFEATPIFFENTLYFPTAFGKIFALDAVTGNPKWSFDTDVDRSMSFSEVTSRGVSLWINDSNNTNIECSARILYGTIDARLFAVDAQTGEACKGRARKPLDPLLRPACT